MEFPLFNLTNIWKIDQRETNNKQILVKYRFYDEHICNKISINDKIHLCWKY